MTSRPSFAINFIQLLFVSINGIFEALSSDNQFVDGRPAPVLGLRNNLHLGDLGEKKRESDEVSAGAMLHATGCPSASFVT